MRATSVKSETSVNESAETLRLALPLMTRNEIPVTPENYAIWFHYVANDRPGLKKYIDELLEKQTKFTPELNESIHQQFLSDGDLVQIEQVRRSIASALAEATTALRQSGSAAGRYSEILVNFDRSSGSAESLDDIYRLLHSVLEETQQMQKSMEQLQQEFIAKSEDMDKLKKELEQVRKQASTDALTGLYNRSTFFNSMEEIEAAAGSTTNPYCVVMIDIDNFKRVNDTFGHLVGDKVIRFVADSLRQSIKGQDCAARFGGEEYAMLLPETRLKDAVTLCNKIRRNIALANLVRSGTKEPIGQITISVGVAENHPGESRMDLMARADEALYRSKQDGRNRVSTAED